MQGSVCVLVNFFLHFLQDLIAQRMRTQTEHERRKEEQKDTKNSLLLKIIARTDSWVIGVCDMLIKYINDEETCEESRKKHICDTTFSTTTSAHKHQFVF